MNISLPFPINTFLLSLVRWSVTNWKRPLSRDYSYVFAYCFYVLNNNGRIDTPEFYSKNHDGTSRLHVSSDNRQSNGRVRFNMRSDVRSDKRLQRPSKSRRRKSRKKLHRDYLSFQ